MIHAMLNSEKLLRIFIDHAPAAMALFDREMRYMLASRRWLTDFNLGERDLTGFSHYEVFPEIPEKWKEVHRRALAGEEVRANSDSFEREDGSIQWLHWEVLPWRDEAGDIGGILIFAEDITHRKQAEELLRKTHDELEMRVKQRTTQLSLANTKLHALIDTIPDRAWIKDLDGRYIIVNQAFSKACGVPVNEVTGKTDFDIWPKKRADHFRSSDQFMLTTKMPFKVEMRQVDGDELIFDTVKVPLYNEEGIFIGIVGIARDITNRKRAEEALLESKREYEEIVSQAPVGIYKFRIKSDDVMLFDYVSPRFCELLDVKCEDVLRDSKVVFDPVHPEDLEHFIKAGETARNTAGEFKWEGRFVVNGHVKFLRIESLPKKSEKGSGDIVWTGMLRDITARKLAEMALSESERDFRLLADTMPQIVWICRTDGWNIYFNQQWMDYTGLTLEESYGHGWIKPFHPDDRQRAWDAWQNSTINGAEYDLECRLRRLDGVYRWWLIRGAPVLDARGAVLKWFGTCTDIDGLKRAEVERIAREQQLRQIQKTESLVRMAGAIAHNFNNMLGVAIGNLELAVEEAPQGSDLETCITEAIKASGRAAEISRFMLTYLGQISKKAEPVDPAGVVRKAVALMKASIPDNVRVNTELPPLYPVIQGNGAQLRQVLTNLTLNAVEAIGERVGEITLAIQSVPGDEIRASNLFPLGWEAKSEEYACLTVSDTGCGMDEATLDKIFDPFFTTKFVGRGMGLSVVLGLVRAFEGAVAVESLPGRGSTFKIFFPVSQEGLVSATVAIPVTRSEAGGGLVLVVDDEPMIRDMAAAMLKRTSGYEVITACSGAEAVEIFRMRKDEISLVLLDIRMPGMNGWETFPALRELRSDIPAILVSGDEGQSRPGSCLEIPDAFIYKPYQLSDLRAAIALVATGRKGNRPIVT